jgi:hypothetical protein
MAQISAVDAVIAALLTTLDTALAVPVYDGMEATSASDTEFVLVGDDGDPDALTNEPAAEVTQDWAAFELGSRDEEGVVTCAAISQSGDSDLAARRAASKALMVSIEAALRASENLAGVVAVGGIDTIRLYQMRNTNGSVARRTFTFRYRAFQG